MLNKINANPQVHEMSQSWVLIPNVIKPMLAGITADAANGTGFEDVYKAQSNKNKVVSVLQFTDDWTASESEDIDTSFASWAKSTAKTFMTVVDTALPDEALSVKQMKKAGHPNIKVFNRLDAPGRSEEIAKLFESTATVTKTTTTKQKAHVSITPDDGITLTKASLVSADGKTTDLKIDGNKVSADLNDLADGKYTVNYSFKGDVKSVKKITSSVSVDGKEVDKKEDTISPVAPPPAPVKPVEPKVTKRTEKIPFKTETKEDPTLPEGEKKVIQKGVEGEKEYVTTTLEDVAGQDGTAEGSVQFTTKASVTTSNEIKPRSIFAIGEFTKDSDQTKKVLDQIKATTTEVVKKGANQTVKISIGGQGVTVTKATLKGAVNKDLPIKDGKVEFSEALADGSYTLEYAAKGNGTLKSLVTVDGKEVGNKTVELKGTPGQKGESKTVENIIKNPINEIIHIGTKGAKSDVTEKKVPFETIRKEDPTLEEGKEKVIQEGVEGVIKVTTTYDTQKGQKVDGSEKVTEKETVKKVDKIIAVGTKGSKSEVTEKKVPFETIKKDDPTLEEGQEKVVQEGVEGVIKVTTTYETQKGEKVKGSEKVTEEKVTDKVDKIIAVGTKGSKSEVTEKKVPFETIYKQDPTLKKGDEKVLQEGVEGVIKVTTTYETQKGKKVDGSEKVTEETVTEKVDKIVAQGTMEKRKVRYRVVDSKGQELVKQTDVMEAYQDEEYKVETPKLDGYRLELAKDSVPATGKVADRDVLVTFVAVKIGKPVTLKFVDESGSEIAEKKVLTGENAEVDTEFTGEAPETIEKDGVKYAFVGIKQTGSKERKVSGKVTDQEQVIEAVYAKPKELPKTSEQAKQRNTVIVALLSVVGLGGLATYLGLRKRDEK